MEEVVMTTLSAIADCLVIAYVVTRTVLFAVDWVDKV